MAINSQQSALRELIVPEVVRSGGGLWQYRPATTAQGSLSPQRSVFTCEALGTKNNPSTLPKISSSTSRATASENAIPPTTAIVVNTSSIDRLLDTAGLKFPGLSST